MKIIFLGTNGWFNTNTGNTPCILIETEEKYIILDAGDGIRKIDQYIKKKKPVYLFLSHFHLDHLSGLHILDKFDSLNFIKEVNVYGPPALKKVFQTIVNRPYTVYYKDLKTKIILNPLTKKTFLSFKFEYRELLHSSQCFGYRFSLENKIITYCTDTGVCDNLLYLAKKADLLITECSFKSGQENPDWPHLNPEEAASMAKKSQAKKLALTHFDANRYRTIKERKESEKIAQKTFPNTLAAVDNLEISI